MEILMLACAMEGYSSHVIISPPKSVQGLIPTNTSAEFFIDLHKYKKCRKKVVLSVDFVVRPLSPHLSVYFSVLIASCSSMLFLELASMV